MLHTVGDIVTYWLVRLVIGPGLLATAPLHRSWKWQIAFIVLGLVLVEAGNVVSDRRKAYEERRLARATKAREVEAAHRRIEEILIDAVTVFEAHRPKERGRFRANVMLIEGNVLRMEYRTSGYTEEEEALEWHREEGSAGRAWDRGQTLIAPTDDAPLPTVDEASTPSRGWGMTASQVRNTLGVKAIISVPIFLAKNPTQVVAVFNLDDTLPPTDYGEPIFAATGGVAERVGQELCVTGLRPPRRVAPKEPEGGGLLTRGTV